MSKQILLETLGRLRFLQGVAPQHLECLAGIARMEEYDEGETLFAAGEPVDDVYLVIYGEIALEVASSGVNPQLLLSVGAGENFGWSALMHRTHRVATAKATAPTQVFRIDGKRLLALCEEYPRFGYQIMRHGRRLGEPAQRLAAEVFRRVPVAGDRIPLRRRRIRRRLVSGNVAPSWR